MKKKSILFVSYWVFIALPAFTQEQIGLKLSNYAGIQAATMNPAWNVNSTLRWDLNIVSAGIFADNDYLFVEKGSLIKVLLKTNQIIPDPAIKKPNKNDVDPIYYNYEDKYKTYDLYQSATIMGPSAMFNISNHTFGVYFGVRDIFYDHMIAKDFGYYYFSDSATTQMITAPFKTGLMTWGEVGINYGGNVINDGINEFAVGVNLKYLMGFDAVVGKSNETSTIVKIDEGVKLASGNVDLNYSTNYSWDYNDATPHYKLHKNGNGVGIDLGFVYTNKATTDPYANHKFKIGMSLLDIGRIKFTDNAAVNYYDRNDTVTFFNTDFKEVRDLEFFVKTVGQIAYGDSTALKTGNEFTSWLPMSLSVQADYNIANNFYISALGMFRLPNPKLGVDRENIIAVTPRYEKRWWEIGLPLTLYDLKRPLIGAYARLGWFTIGSEKFAGWFFPTKKWGGTDIYIAIKVNPFKEANYVHDKHRHRPVKNFGCPKF